MLYNHIQQFYFSKVLIIMKYQNTLILSLAVYFIYGVYSPPNVFAKEKAQTNPQELTKIAVVVEIGAKKISAEIANTPEARQKGLMYRQKMSDDEGMLFVFPDSAPRCFWMKNTLIPLTAIFINDEQKIINAKDMQPLDESTHCSSAPAKYVLEVNQGWLTKYKLSAEKDVKFNKMIFSW